MNQLTNLTDAADQVTNVVLDDKSIATFEFIYRPGIQRWVFNVSHPTLITADNPSGSINGYMLCVHPNLLRQFKNIATFGLTVISTDGADPYAIEDFVNGRVSVYVLNAYDVGFVEQQIFLVPAA